MSAHRPSHFHSI